jgi:DNA-binding LacI/PurR family transcriptional regulator
MRAPTIRDVASRAGVGVGTVSRILNGGHQVSGPTRERVEAAIAELGFRPSRRGQAFARGTTSSVVALVPFVTHPSAVERVSGMIHGLRESALPVSVADVEVPEHQHEHLASMVDDLRPEGVVVVSLHLTDHELASLDRAGVRPVLVDAEAPGLTSLVVDDVGGGRMATEYLIGLGHRRIAFVGDLERDPFGFTSSERRHRGYVEALAAAGIRRRADFERTGRHSQANARGQAAALFASSTPPTAVFAASDTQALGVLQAARDASRRVPEDVSVIGFDDIAVADLVGLSTVRQPLVESGRRAVAVVLEQIADPGRAAERIELPLEVVGRSTTGPPPPTHQRRHRR